MEAPFRLIDCALAAQVSGMQKGGEFKHAGTYLHDNVLDCSSVVVDNFPVILATADHIVVLITRPLMRRRYRPPSFVSVATDRR